MVRLVQFTQGADGAPRVGVQLGAGGDIADVTATDPSIPSTVLEILRADALGKVKTAAGSGKNIIPLADVALRAPIRGCEKVICIGMNYVDHCTEQNMPVPTEPVVFSKFANCITDPGADIIKSKDAINLDFEVELVIVVGKTAKRVSEADALGFVAGYTVAHDVSERHWQLKRNGGQWLIGKTMDTFCPIGPAIVTTDEIGDAHKLGIRCRLNGETVQDSNTDQLVFKTEKIIAWITQFVTLTPGDIILTGTPPGVGCFRKPPLWLKAGDVVECEIDGIGTISNPIVDEI